MTAPPFIFVKISYGGSGGEAPPTVEPLHALRAHKARQKACAERAQFHNRPNLKDAR